MLGFWAWWASPASHEEEVSVRTWALADPGACRQPRGLFVGGLASGLVQSRNRCLRRVPGWSQAPPVCTRATVLPSSLPAALGCGAPDSEGVTGLRVSHLPRSERQSRANPRMSPVSLSILTRYETVSERGHATSTQPQRKGCSGLAQGRGGWAPCVQRHCPPWCCRCC